MKMILITLTLAPFAFAVIGCGEQTGPGDDVNAQIENMPAEERFDMIKRNTGMGPAMKEAAVDNLPVSDEQKEAWKEELRSGS